MEDRRGPASCARYAVPGFVFLLALLPRAVHPISWPMQWYERAVRFSEAVLAGDWAATYQQYHPGVTTMWLSGLGLRAFGSWRGLTPDQLLGATPTKPGVIAQAIVAGVLPLAVAIALCIALSYSLLRRLAGSRVALVAGILLALDPYYIARSQVLHVDALLATLMLVSALYLLNYTSSWTRRDLLMSAFFGGLALLTKSPGIFVLLYAGLIVAVKTLTDHQGGRLPGPGWQDWIPPLRRTLQRILVWVIVALATFVVLWPSMWVRPSSTLAEIVQAVVGRVETAHRNPVFFNGQITFEDPGVAFYLATLAWKTTAITLPMGVAGLVLPAVQARPRGRYPPTILWLAAYAGLFVAQMCLAARKEPRYILPVFPAIDVLAAFGLASTVDLMGEMGCLRAHRWFTPAALAGLLMLQASLVLPRHPYYGTLYNRLLGGTSGARDVLPLQHEGEGLDLAARHLNELPRAVRSRVGIHQRGASMLRRYSVGATTGLDNPTADYRVYFINQVMRQLDLSTWQEVWMVDREGEPLWTAEFGGVTYVWIYGSPPEPLAVGGPEHRLDHRLGEHIVLERARLSGETLHAGERVNVALIWTSDGKIDSSYKVFCHLLSPEGALVAQEDGLPVGGARPTLTWRAGEVIEDSCEIALSSDLSPGEYEFSVGMYDPATMERVRAYDSSGARAVPDRIVVQSIRVERSSDVGE